MLTQMPSIRYPSGDLIEMGTSIQFLVTAGDREIKQNNENDCCFMFGNGKGWEVVASGVSECGGRCFTGFEISGQKL